MDDRGIGIRFPVGAMSRPAQWCTQSHMQWVPGSLFLGVKQPGPETNYSTPSNAEVKVGGTSPPLYHMPSRFSVSLSTGTTLPLYFVNTKTSSARNMLWRGVRKKDYKTSITRQRLGKQCLEAGILKSEGVHCQATAQIAFSRYNEQRSNCWIPKQR
jgi:hypothetical protein